VHGGEHTGLCYASIQVVRSVFFLVLALATGCEAVPQGLSWNIDFGPGVAESEAVLFEAEITEGGCREDGVTRFRTDFSRDEEAPRPTRLESGVYAFQARVMNADCVWYGSGCSPATLPTTTGEVTTILTGPMNVDGCPGGSCVMGECTGAIDAGDDTSVPDTSAPDTSAPDTSGRDLDMDMDGFVASMDCDDMDPDRNPGESESCNGIDDDCDGMVDDGGDGLCAATTRDVYVGDTHCDFAVSDGRRVAFTLVQRQRMTCQGRDGCEFRVDRSYGNDGCREEVRNCASTACSSGGGCTDGTSGRGNSCRDTGASGTGFSFDPGDCDEGLPVRGDGATGGGRPCG